MNIIMNILLMLFIICAAQANDQGMNWKRMRSASEMQGLPLTFSPTAIDQKKSVVYVLDQASDKKSVFEIDLKTGLFRKLSTSGSLPQDIWAYSYDPSSRRLLAVRSGRDAVYELALDGDATWKKYIDGSFDSQSYGAAFFWNLAEGKLSFFGGYGGFRNRNWIWETSGSQWKNIVPDNDNCEPARRAEYSKVLLGSPQIGDVYFYSGTGSCSGVQNEGCKDGIGWGDGWCWMRDIWRYDPSTKTFRNMLPPHSSSYAAEGPMAYDYIRECFVLIPAFLPPNDKPDQMSLPLSKIYTLQKDSSVFTPRNVGGDVPPSRILNEIKTSVAYYDAVNKRVVLIRGDGIWALEDSLKSPGSCNNMQRMDSVSINVREPLTWKSPVLIPGREYKLKGYGVWNAANAAQTDEDFCYTYAVPCDPSKYYGRVAWVRVGYDLDSMLKRDQYLNPDEKQVNCSSHIYTYTVIGDGRPLILDFRDSPYSDNSGNLSFAFYGCDGCDLGVTQDSILGYRKVETHQVVTYALRNNPSLSYKWIATGGYMLGASTNHYCDVIWGYDKFGSVCCIVSDSACSDTLCVTTTINNATTGGIAGEESDVPTMSVRPNPANEIIDISTALGENLAHYELIDVTGLVIQRTEGVQARMSVANIVPGVYHLVQRDQYGNVIGMQRVVVQR